MSDLFFNRNTINRIMRINMNYPPAFAIDSKRITIIFRMMIWAQSNDIITMVKFMSGFE